MNFLKSLSKVKLQQVILVTIVSLAAVGLIGNFFVATNLSKFSKERARAQKLTAEFAQAQADLRSEESNTHLREQMNAFLDVQKAKMVSGDPFSWIVREMTLVAEKHPVRLGGLRPGSKSSNPTRSKYEMFTVRVEADGTYDQAGAFIRDLENHFPTGEIRGLEMVVIDDKRASCRVVFDFALLMRPGEPSQPASERKIAS